MNADPVAAINALLAERDLYMRILDLSREQLRLAAAGKIEDLLGVVAEKGGLTDQVSSLSEASRPLKSDWPASAASLSPHDARLAGQLIEEIAGLLSEIVANEDACQKEVGQRRNGALEGILRVQMGRKAAQAYGQKAPGPAKFKDERK